MNPTNPNTTTQPNPQDPKDLQKKPQVNPIQQSIDPTNEAETQKSKPDGYYGDDTDLSNDELDLSFLDDEKPADAE